MPRRSRGSRLWRARKGSCPRSSPLTRSAGSFPGRSPRGSSCSSTSRGGATRTSTRCGASSAASEGSAPVADLETAIRARRDGGGRAFVPYVTGGLPGVDAELLRGLEHAGADAIEVGIPFSDPVMDGGVIQEASSLALEAGARPADVLADVAQARLGVPVAAMTYLNPVLRRGLSAFLAEATAARVSGLIVPDLPVDEADDLVRACRKASVDPVLLAAPGASPERLRSSPAHPHRLLV